MIIVLEFIRFEGDTPEENEEIGENPRIQVLEGDNEEEIPQISEPELEIPTETETSKNEPYKKSSFFFMISKVKKVFSTTNT